MKTKILLSSVFFILLSANALAGGMQSQVDKLVDDMSTTTSPGKFETTERSGFQGGRYTEKYPIANFDLFHMDLPSARGGCNGIDVFGGSYSFIDADQLIESLKKVAANAKGYAFQLAMDQMCPSCVKWMNELRDSMQKLNSELGNSCQLAQGIVNGGINAIAGKEIYQNNLKATASGIAGDLFSVKEAVTNVNPGEWQWFGSLDPAKRKVALETTKGSVGYRALVNNGAKTWYSSSEDIQLIEEILSLTGHVVVHSMVNDTARPDPTSPSGNAMKPSIDILPPIPGQSISLENLMNGDGVAKYKVYDCSKSVDLPGANNCNISVNDTKEITLKGISKKIEDVLMGPNSYWRLNKLRTVTSSISTSDQNILMALPGNFGGNYMKLSALHPDAAQLFSEQSLGAITLEFTYKIVIGQLDSFEAAVANSNDSYKDEQLRQISGTRERIRAEYDLLRTRYGSLKEVQTYFANLLMITPKQSYIANTASKGAGQ